MKPSQIFSECTEMYVKTCQIKNTKKKTHEISTLTNVTCVLSQFKNGNFIKCLAHPGGCDTFRSQPGRLQVNLPHQESSLQEAFRLCYLETRLDRVALLFQVISGCNLDFLPDYGIP